jgi:AraC-like DNA-binding protein
MMQPMDRRKLKKAMDSLSEQFPHLAWNFLPKKTEGRTELISQWLGTPAEEIMVVCFKGKHYIEQYHRQDFFFINFVCQHGYDVLSAKYDRPLHLEEGDCYIGQPFSGYALKIDSDEEVVMIGIHIRRDVFYHKFFYPLSRDNTLFHFFLDPHTNQFSDEYIRLHIDSSHPIWTLVYQMLLEYAEKDDYTQAILEPMMLTLTMHLSRLYHNLHQSEPSDSSLTVQMLHYIESHSDEVTLRDLAAKFGYHPNYVSRYLHEQTGKSFSSLVLEKRMEKAVLLLHHTDLSIETIAHMVGYPNQSNFYKGFRKFYHATPREFLSESGEGPEEKES